MLRLDFKEQIMIKHYKKLFVEHSFDEYDILGFLILVRRLIRNINEYNGILEFADLIAHRERDRGQAFEAMDHAIKKHYATYDGKTVIGYEGITQEEWKKAWKKLCSELSIPYSKRLLDEITLCVCSLAHGSIYQKADRYLGKMYVAIDSETVALVTTEGKKDSLSVGFFVYKGISAEMEKGYEFPNTPFETKRIANQLALVTSDQICFFKLNTNEE